VREHQKRYAGCEAAKANDNQHDLSNRVLNQPQRPVQAGCNHSAQGQHADEAIEQDRIGRVPRSGAGVGEEPIPGGFASIFDGRT
jgi:hypothetical protein